MTITVANHTLLERQYRFGAPSGIGAARPLLIAIHPGGSNGLIFEGAVSQLNFVLTNLADANKFYIAYPHGNEPAPSTGSKTWNAGWCCGYSVSIQKNDIQFIRLLIRQLKLQYDIGNVYLFGYSNGAMLVYSLAALYPTEVKAAMVVAGALVVDHDACAGTIALPFTHIYGEQDVNVNPNGGTGPASGANYPALADTRSFLVGRGMDFTTINLHNATHDFATVKAALLAERSTTIEALVSAMITAGDP